MHVWHQALWLQMQQLHQPRAHRLPHLAAGIVRQGKQPSKIPAHIRIPISSSLNKRISVPLLRVISICDCVWGVHTISKSSCPDKSFLVLPSVILQSPQLVGRPTLFVQTVRLPGSARLLFCEASDLCRSTATEQHGGGGRAADLSMCSARAEGDPPASRFMMDTERHLASS